VRRDRARALAIFDPRGAAVINKDLGCKRPHLDLQIRVSKGGLEIGDRRAAPSAIADRHLHDREALLLAAVVVLDCPIACFPSGGREGVHDRIRVARVLSRERAVAATKSVGPFLPRFLTPEVWKHVRIRPCRQAVGGPAVIVAAIAAHVGHGIDR
jgi:hypothetical protein